MTKQEFLAASLPYGLKLQFRERGEKYCRKQVIGTLGGIYSDGTIECHDTVNAYPARFKSVLRPLSDLTKEIEYKGEKFVPIDELNKLHPYGRYFFMFEIDTYGVFGLRTPESWLPFVSYFPAMLKLIEWHFDIADLISKGEAVDVNTLPENPYK